MTEMMGWLSCLSLFSLLQVLGFLCWKEQKIIMVVQSIVATRVLVLLVVGSYTSTTTLFKEINITTRTPLTSMSHMSYYIKNYKC